MDKRTDHLIAKRLKDLPIYEPADDLWNSIEQALTLDGVIEKRISELPLHSPNSDAWEVIEKNLPGIKRISLSRRYLYIAAAVSLFLVVGIPQVFNRLNGVIVESEIVYPEAETPDISAGDYMAIEEIKSLCNSGIPVCETDDFKEKLALYQELDRELRQIETVVDHLGDSPVIIKSIIRLENLKADTLQELIQLIYS